MTKEEKDWLYTDILANTRKNAPKNQFCFENLKKKSQGFSKQVDEKA